MILIVEDHDDSRDMLARLLRRQGYVVRTAACAAAALALAGEQAPRLFILDQDMPGMCGTELLRAIRSDPALDDSRVIFYSGTFEHTLAKIAMELGAMEWLVKGVHSPKHMLAAVARAYDPDGSLH
jgi:CheY-like chemotaxis protein